MAVACRNVCGEILRPARLAHIVVAVFVARFKRSVMADRVRWPPLAAGNRGLPGAESIRVSQRRIWAAVAGQIGIARSLRPLPRRRTLGLLARATSDTLMLSASE